MNSSLLSTKLGVDQLEDRSSPALLSISASFIILPPPPPPPPGGGVVVIVPLPPAPGGANAVSPNGNYA